MLKQFNIKRDKRTLRNFAVLPIILFVRIPLILLYWGVEYAYKRLENLCDELPGWDS